MFGSIILLVTAALITAYLFFNYQFYKSFITSTKCNFKVPGPPAKNILYGNITDALDTPENVFKVVRKWAQEHYPIYLTWAFFYLTAVNIVNPYDFETIMSNPKHNTKSPLYFILHKWLGTGLLTSEGKKWQDRRKILTSSFHFNILQEYIKVFNKETVNLVNVFKKECHKPYIAVTDHISEFTLNTIGETAMGISFHEESVSQKYKKAIHDIGKLFLYRTTRPWLLHPAIFKLVSRKYLEEQNLVKTLHLFTEELITKREKNFKPLNVDNMTYSKRKRLAMLDLLLTAKIEDGTISDEGIREEVDTFMFEGHDTTSVALCYCMMLIACHKDVQNKLYKEILQVVQDPSKIDYQTLNELKYMDRCIKEILRIYPSVPFISRILGEDVVTHSGHLLKRGAVVHLHIFDVHHNPEFFPQPEKFDPDRFLPENCQNRNNFAYVPFSAGSRNCIGQKFALLELKTVLCGILREFVLEPVNTPETIEIIADMVLRTKESIKVKFVPRKTETHLEL